MAMEVTHTLREMFAAEREKQRADARPAPAPLPGAASASEGVRQLADSIWSVQQLIERALRTCQGRISGALRAMDECSPFAMTCEKTLLLSEAELTTADASAKAVIEALKSARAAQSEMRETPSRGVDDGGEDDGANSWLHRALAQTTRGKAIAADSGVSPRFSDDQLNHFEALLGVLKGRLSQAQLRLALCKEDLALYKSERYMFGRCGVLSCSDPSKRGAHGNTTAGRGGSVEGSRPIDTATDGAYGSASRASPTRHRVAGFGLVTDVSKLTMSTVDEVLRKTTSTVREAGARAADTRLGAALSTLRAGIGQIDVDFFADKKGGAHNGADGANPSLRARHFDFTEEEQAALAQQNADLALEQHEATAQEAKAIEMSVRELAQLTTLMNEKVVEQSEQFSILLKNTDAAHKNVQKALAEVQKPKKSYWNATRQLIALLWFCTALLLVANWWIR